MAQNKVVSGDKATVTMATMWLLNCRDHAHNLQVLHVAGERMLIADTDAIQCLKDNGVRI